LLRGAAGPAEGALGLTAYDLAIVDIGLPGIDGLGPGWGVGLRCANTTYETGPGRCPEKAPQACAQPP